jgi:hypothetical protein
MCNSAFGKAAMKGGMSDMGVDFTVIGPSAVA